MTQPSTARKRILLMGDASQIHLKRWESYLRVCGYETMTLSLERVDGIEGPSRRIRIPSFVPPFMRYPMAVPEVRRVIHRFEPDLINAHFLPNYGVIASMSGFEPWILSTWGSDIMLLPDSTPFHMIRTKEVIKRATAITSDADVMTERLIELGAMPDRVVTFPMGVDRKVFKPAATADRDGHLRILSNRKLEALYNIETIVSSLPEVVRNEPGAVLTVAGDGDRAPHIRAMAARIAPSGSIHFVGHVSHDRLPSLLADTDIYVSMSLSDTTSVSLLEAMACGVFPIVSDIPANREWVDDGENGVLVPPRNSKRLSEAILGVWRAPELRRSAAAHNFRLIEERADWYRNMDVLKQLLERLMS